MRRRFGRMFGNFIMKRAFRSTYTLESALSVRSRVCVCVCVCVFVVSYANATAAATAADRARQIARKHQSPKRRFA